MKKGYCHNCNKDYEVRRIFDVNSDAKYCYCPHCGKRYRPKVVINAYDRVIARYLKRANFYLRNANEYLLAYNLFAYVLELEPENKSAKLGRLLSLSYLSSLRRNRFVEVRELLDMEKADFHGAKIKSEYSSILLGLDRCSNKYMEKAKKKLTFRTYFYDVECIKLYYRHVGEVIKLKRLLLEELSMIDDSKGAEVVSESIKALENEYNNINFTVDGHDHLFANYSKNGDPLITNGRRKIDTKLSKYRMATLNTEDKKLRVLDDAVFKKVYRVIFRTFKATIPCSIVVLGLALTMLVLYLIFMHTAAAPFFLGTFIAFAVSALSFIVVRFLFAYILKKPRF